MAGAKVYKEAAVSLRAIAREYFGFMGWYVAVMLVLLAVDFVWRSIIR